MHQQTPPADLLQRQQALDPSKSLLVRAPAGSGKTSLLVARFLRLLARVEDPSLVVAITHTNKAADEMRARILDALHSPDKLDGLSAAAASEAIAHARQLGWKLTPNQLRVSTIDSLCAQLAAGGTFHQLNFARARLGEDQDALYKEAARSTMAGVWQGKDDVLQVWQHLGCSFDKLEKVLVNLLQRREQWAELVVQFTGQHAEFIELCNQGWAAIANSQIEQLQANVQVQLWCQAAAQVLDLGRDGGTIKPQDVELLELLGGLSRGVDPANRQQWWRHLQGWVCTKKGTIYTASSKMTGIAAQGSYRGKPELGETRKALCDQINVLLKQLKEHQHLLSQNLVDPQLPHQHDKLINALGNTAQLAFAELLLVFAQRGVLDYTQMALNAHAALKERQHQPHETPQPQEIHHLLVDEFQDCSPGQWELLSLLSSHWDGNQTLFAVGDPMQSIYAFRKADVRLFSHAVEHGIGKLKPALVQLTCNFRSQPVLVDWVNAKGPQLLRTSDSQVEFSPAVAASKHPSMRKPALYLCPPGEREIQLIELLRKLPQLMPECTRVAILTPARSMAMPLLRKLEVSGLPFTAVEFLPLSEQQYAIDLRNLAELLLDPHDWRCWLGLLRSPQLGLSLNACTRLFASNQPPLQALDQASQLGKNKQQRLAWLLGRVKPVLDARGLRPLAWLLDELWRSLGFASQLDANQQARGATILDLISQAVEAGGWWLDWSELDERMNKSNVDIIGDGNTCGMPGIELMTCHKAKGLEFDLVILPYADKSRRTGVHGEPDPFLFQYSLADKELLLAASSDKLSASQHTNYDYLNNRRKAAELEEYKRLLYVSLTRAKHALWLFAEQSETESRETTSSFLLMLKQEDTDAHNQTGMDTHKLPSLEPQQADPQPLVLRTRIRDLVGFNASLPEPAPIPDKAAAGEPGLPGYAPLLGSQLHQLMHWLGNQPNWQTCIADMLPSWQAQLAWRGVARADLPTAAAQLQAALHAIAGDARATWLLAPHPQRHSEWSLLDGRSGEPVTRIPDLCFAEPPDYWVIDYKAMHRQPQESDQQLLVRAGDVYAEQLQAYGELIVSMSPGPAQGLKMRYGIYLMLQQLWLEWA